MWGAVEKAGVANTVWYNYRRLPAVTLAKQVVDSGKLGRIFDYRPNSLQDWTIKVEIPQVDPTTSVWHGSFGDGYQQIPVRMPTMDVSWRGVRWGFRAEESHRSLNVQNSCDEDGIGSAKRKALAADRGQIRVDSPTTMFVTSGRPAFECADAPAAVPDGSDRVRRPVFVSFSHKDKIWLDSLKTMLAPVVQAHGLLLWDDSRIQAGSHWRSEIATAIESARVAVLLVSKHFLASEFIVNNELPPLLDAAKNRGLRILWVCVGHCLWHRTEIADYQAAHVPSVPLSALDDSERDRVLVEVCEEIMREGL